MDVPIVHHVMMPLGEGLSWVSVWAGLSVGKSFDVRIGTSGCVVRPSAMSVINTPSTPVIHIQRTKGTSFSIASAFTVSRTTCLTLRDGDELLSQSAHIIF